MQRGSGLSVLPVVPSEASSSDLRINRYRTVPAGRTEIGKAVTPMKEDGVIRDVESKWASPVLLITYSYGSMRFCVNYRRLNEMNVRDSYQLSRMKS